VNRPYANYPTSQTVRQSIRPFPQYNTSINPTVAPLGNTWYDALQVTLTKRYSHGLTFNGNYTYSKNLDLMSSPDVFNRQLGKNLSANDLPHQLLFSAEYQTPRPSKGMKVIGNPVVSYILGGWGLGVYAQYQSAPLLDRPAAGSTLPISDWLGRCPGGAQLKIGPDGQPMNPYAVNWTDLNGKVHPEPLDINCHCYDPTRTVVLNPNAWVAVPDGQWQPTSRASATTAASAPRGRARTQVATSGSRSALRCRSGWMSTTYSTGRYCRNPPVRPLTSLLCRRRREDSLRAASGPSVICKPGPRFRVRPAAVC
jgi:hypothetical protein